MPVRTRRTSGGRRAGLELGADHGFALPLVLSILAIVALLVAAAVGLATHNTDRANRDRAAARALAAADAGADAAIYRMNKALVASQVEGVLGLPTAALAETGCLSIDADLLNVVDIENPNSWCPASSGTEDLDGPAAAGESWSEASFSYTISTNVNVGGGPLIERLIVSSGMAADVTKRVMTTVRAQVGASGNLLAVFEQVGYTQCTPETPNGANPASGCD